MRLSMMAGGCEGEDGIICEEIPILFLVETMNEHVDFLHADKEAAVVLSISLLDTLIVRMEYRVKHECGIAGSTQVGLRSSRRMMEKMGGGLHMQIAGGRFLAEVFFKNPE